MRLLASAVGWDYPSIHGEHCTTYQHYHLSLGSSPLVRGAHGCRIVGLCNLRIIPARAGSTWTRSSSWTTGRDHPRSCGEHNDPSDGSNVASGSSPLVRGARLVAVSFEVPFEPGSSPLVRGALPCPDLRRQAGGIIPARAGSTGSTTSTERGRRDHPRSCGEHGPRAGACSLPTGSSPLVRGALICIIRHTRFCRIIPARAGSTALSRIIDFLPRDHPRSCGEHSSLLISSLCVGGSSPLVRGALSRGI